MFEAFTKVTQTVGLGPHCPARLNIYTGELQLNMDVWPYMTNSQRRDVTAHEEGHWMLQTFDEKLADNYALHKQALQGYSLREAVDAIADLLNPNDAEHVERAWLRFQLAQSIDASKRGLAQTVNYSGCNCDGNCNHAHYIGQDSIYDDYRHPMSANDVWVNYGFLGICFSKKCREKKAERKDAKLEAKNAAKVLLAQQGVKSGIGGVFQDLGQGLSGVVNLAKSVAPAVAAIASPGIGGGIPITGDNIATQTLQGQQANAMTNALGGSGAALGNSNTYATQMMLQQQIDAEAKKKKQEKTYIIIAVAVIALVLLIFLLKQRNTQ